MERGVLRRPALLAAVILAMGVMSGCSVDAAGASDPSVAQASAGALVGGVWIAEEIDGQAVSADVQSTLSVDAANRVAGKAGCNRYAGAATIDGSAIHLGPLAMTRMACLPAVSAQEQRFVDALQAVARYQITPDGKLELYDAADARRLVFVQMS